MMNKSSNKKPIRTGEVELLFVKSKVYLHPTSLKKDNVVGFLTLSRGTENTPLSILFSFTCESDLSSKDLETYEKCDLDAAERRGDVKQEDKPKGSRGREMYIVQKPPSMGASGKSFSFPLSFVYSMQLRAPSYGVWFGSLVVNTRDNSKIPIVFFHDSESESTKLARDNLIKSFNPFGDDVDALWGGILFMEVLEKCIHVVRSNVERSVYLINPDSSDLRNFASSRGQHGQNDQDQANEIAIPDFNKLLNKAKWRILETVASFSAKARNQVIDAVEEHIPPVIKNNLSTPEVQRLSQEFDSARVYLAKWAQQVKEEAEESQRKFLLENTIYDRINRELGSNEILTEEEINNTSRRNQISRQEWDSIFDSSGRLCITTNEIKDRIFHGGLSPQVRPEAWLFLLEVYPWDSSKEERDVIKQSLETSYMELKEKWVGDVDKQQADWWKDQKHRIEKDIHRTDRNLPIFSSKLRMNSTSDRVDANPEERESSPDTPDESEDDFDISDIKNPHLFAMREILITYNEHNQNLGYVQGMTDLLSPLYVTFQDETLTFWAFVRFMDRMERNFVRDQSGMKKQMSTLNKLLQFMLPNLYKHLEKCESVDLFFFFRMLLVWFKREMNWDDVLRVWEIFWTDYYTSQFHLFFALAVLSDNERIIIQNLTKFDEVLKYMNDLSMKLNLSTLLIRAELLFLKFSRMVDLIDKENSNRPGPHLTPSDLPEFDIGPDLRELLSKDLVIQRETSRIEDSDD